MKKDVIIGCGKGKYKHIISARNINTSGKYSFCKWTNLLDFRNDEVLESGLVSSKIWDFSLKTFVESGIIVNHSNLDVPNLLRLVVAHYLLKGELLGYNLIFYERIE